jgi:uncharacterized protein YecE (DUF72 family)
LGTLKFLWLLFAIYSILIWQTKGEDIMHPNSNLRIGPAGWQRADWRELLDRGPATGRPHRLERLSEYVNLAEIGQTFEEPLKPEIAHLYLKKVQHRADFLFTAMLGRRFTYDRALEPEAVARWKAGFEPLARARRLGALVMQFPWAFRFNAENREYLIRLRREFGEFPLCAEMRHDSWLCDEAITTLIGYHVGLVGVDQPSYFRAMPPAARLTSGVAVVRLHGRRGPDAFRDFEARPDTGYLYDLDELLEWRGRIERLAANAERTLVITTNAWRGGALVNALQLGEILSTAELRAPAGLIAAYPAELAAFRATRPLGERLRRAA